MLARHIPMTRVLTARMHAHTDSGTIMRVASSTARPCKLPKRERLVGYRATGL